MLQKKVKHLTGMLVAALLLVSMGVMAQQPSGAAGKIAKK